MRALGATLCLAMAATCLVVSAEPASACGWVYYEGYQRASKGRVEIEKALSAGKWKKARSLLLAVQKSADAHRKKAEPGTGIEHGGWMWKDQGWFYYQLATAHYHLRETKAALAAIQASVKAVRKDGYDFKKRDQIFLLYGNIQRRRGKYKHAVKLLRVAVRARRQDPRLWATLGTAQEEAGDLAGAEKSLARALALNPDHHGGMEWVHLEVIKFKRQLVKAPDSWREKPFLQHYRGKRSPAELRRAIQFARQLAPQLPISVPGVGEDGK